MIVQPLINAITIRQAPSNPFPVGPPQETMVDVM
jgi:hypothetical protein